MFCTSCGARSVGARFCTSCGAVAPAQEATTTAPPPSGPTSPLPPPVAEAAPWAFPPPTGAPARGRPSGVVLAAALGAVVVLGAGGATAWTVLRDDPAPAGATAAGATQSEEPTAEGADDAEDDVPDEGDTDTSTVVEDGFESSLGDESEPVAEDTPEPPSEPSAAALTGTVPAQLPPAPFYVAVVVSKGVADGGRAAALPFLTQIEGAGYDAVLFESSRYQHLNAGYWVAAAGTYPSLGEAAAAARDLDGRLPGATRVYARCVGAVAECSGSGG